MKITTQNDLPLFAPHAESEQRTSDGRIWSLLSSLRRSNQRVLAVAWCELLLQARSIVSWVMLAAFTLLTVLFARSQVSTSTIYISNGQAAVAICGYAASFLFFLLPFLHINTFARDRQRQMHQLVWTRPLVSLEYALGKGFGAVCISLLLSWLPLVAGWLTSSIARGQIQPPGLWLSLLLVVGAGSVLVVLCALLWIALIPSLGLLGALLTAGVVVYVDVVFAKSMLFLKNLTAATLFVSPSIGFGPDGALLFWQRTSYVLGGLFCLSLLLLVYQMRERLGIAKLRHLFSTALLIILAGGLLFASIATYQTVGASYTDTGSLTAKPVQATTSNYKIDVSADPASGNVQGAVSFTLTSQGRSISSFVIGLNPGLRVRQVDALPTTSGNTQALPFTETSAGWTTIHMQGTSVESSSSLNLHILYAGQMVLGRDDYKVAAGGYGRENGISWTQNYFYLSFLGQGAGELLGAAGSWYPLPFTQQALDAGERIPVDELHLRFPSSFKVWSGLAGVISISSGNWQELTARPHAGLPLALAAALSDARLESVDGFSFWHQGETPDPMQLQTYRLSIQEARTLNLWLAPTSMPTTFQTVVVPMLPFPVVGSGLLLLPETPGSNGLVPLNGGPYTLKVIARYTAWQLARSWWLNAAFFPFAALTGEPDTQNASSSTSIAPTNALLTMLSAYSAVVITDRVIGLNFFATEMQVCSQAYALTSSSQNLQQEQDIQNEMTALGTTCIFSELVPFRLQLMDNVGFNGLTSFLRQYAFAHALQKTDMRQFLQQASTLAGKDITPEAAPYICPNDGKNTPADGAVDPLTCLNEMYSGT